jgi:hypothetical protein
MNPEMIYATLVLAHRASERPQAYHALELEVERRAARAARRAAGRGRFLAAARRTVAAPAGLAELVRR